MREYIKKTSNYSFIKDFIFKTLACDFLNKNKKNIKLAGVILCVIAIIPVIAVSAIKNVAEHREMNDLITIIPLPIAETIAKKDFITIPSGTVKANPFVPYRNSGSNVVNDVPQFDLIAPPEVVDNNSDAARVMDTIVSGILYDKFSPSAILNIEGNDYLVKKGDVVNNYKVLNIARDSVTVKLGNNTYNAGIGEVLTEGTIHYNDVSNLNKKFGGEK